MFTFCDILHWGGGTALLGARLKEIRLAKGLTQAELGRLVGVGKSAVSQYESGARMPDLDVLARLAGALTLSVDWLMGLQAESGLSAHEPPAAYTVRADIGPEQAYLADLQAHAGAIRSEDDRQTLLAMAKYLARKKTKDGASQP